MIDAKNSSAGNQAPSARTDADARPAYEPPRVTKKKAVTRATLFTGHGPNAGPMPPLVGNG
jgi:hypothetical protein